MAATDAGFDHLTDSAHRMANDMSRAEKAAEGLGSAFRQGALTFIGFDMIRHAITNIVQRTQTWQAMEKAMKVENLSRLGLLRQEIALDNEKLNLEAMIGPMTARDNQLHQLKLEAVTGELRVLEKQRLFADELNKIGHARLVIFGLYKTAALDLFIKERELNQNLIEANSSYQKRGALLRDTLMTQAQLGVSFSLATSSARALVGYAMDTEKSFETNLRLVAQMEQGLGVSVNESAKLASIIERQLGGSFERVAHTVAQLVEDTALAGSEAVHLATVITQAMSRLGPGMSAHGLPEVLKLVGRYESALKQVGGAPGAFEQLITNLTRPEGMVGAGALHVNPEFLATSQGVQNVMDRFSQYGQMLVGQSSGWARQMRLQQLGEMFNLSADQSNQMLIAIKKAKEEQAGQISLQERWRNQLHATNSGIIRLGNSLLALLNGAMYPVTTAVAFLANKLADLVEWALQSKNVVYGVSLALGLGFVGLSVRMFRLGVTLVGVIREASLAAAAMARLSAQLAITSATAGGAGAAARLGPAIPTAFQMLMHNLGRFSMRGPTGDLLSFPTFRAGFGVIVQGITRTWQLLRGILAAIGVAGAVWGGIAIGVAVVAYKANQQWQEIKKLREESKELELINLERQKALEQKRESRIFSEARNFGSPDEILKQYKLMLQDIRESSTTDAEYQARIADAAKRAIDSIDAGVTTKVAFKPLKDRTDVEKTKEEEMLKLNQKILDVNKDSKDEFIKKSRRDAEQFQESEVGRAKDRTFLIKGYYNPVRVWADWLGK